MTVPAGFASRSCFCFWSKDDSLITAIQDNHKTYLHSLWEKGHFYVDITDQEGQKQFSICRLLWSLLFYPVGMLGYLVDTTVKVVLLIGNLLIFLVSTINCDRFCRRRSRGIILVDTLAAVGISLVGIAVPPLAYRLDRMARDTMIAWANSTSTLNSVTN
ncbi:hypothetical protein ACFLR2_01560 [Chlamydiota bacterium]